MEIANRMGNREPRWLRILLIAIAVVFLGVFLFLPLVTVFMEAFRKGAGAYGNRSFRPLVHEMDLPHASGNHPRCSGQLSDLWHGA